jgi:hypothetical protein
VRRAIQVLGIAMMTAGLLLDRSQRTSRASRLPLSLFWVGAVLLVLSSI